MTNSVDVYLVQALTDLHAGTGSEYTRNIDRVIQRDYAGVPVVRGSGVKGALRGHVQNVLEDDVIKRLFGAFVERKDADKEMSEKEKSKKFIPSAVYVSDMQMIAVACNFNDKFPYVLATCPMLLHRAAKAMGLDTSTAHTSGKYLKEELHIGDMRTLLEKRGGGIYTELNSQYSLAHTVAHKLKSAGLLKDAFPLAVVDDDIFICDILSNSLPVVARNSLQRGISKNLWFEEYVPAASIFLSQVAYHHTNESDIASLRNLVKGASDQAWSPPVRMGSGKSVGKGETAWTLVAQHHSPFGKTSGAGNENESSAETAAESSATSVEKKVVALKADRRQIQASKIQDLIQVCVHNRFITKGDGSVLTLPDESATALNRLPSLMRGSLYQIVSTLLADFQKVGDAEVDKASAKTSRNMARFAVAKLIEMHLRDVYVDPKLELEQVQQALLAPEMKNFMDLRKHILKAVDDLKLVSAFCEEPKHSKAA